MIMKNILRKKKKVEVKKMMRTPRK